MRFISRYFLPGTSQPGALVALMAVNEAEVIFAICSRGVKQSTVQEEESEELKVEAYKVLTR